MHAFKKISFMKIIIILLRQKFKLVDNIGILSKWKSTRILTKQSESVQRGGRVFNDRYFSSHWTKAFDKLCLAHCERNDVLDFKKGEKILNKFSCAQSASETVDCAHESFPAWDRCIFFTYGWFVSNRNSQLEGYNCYRGDIGNNSWIALSFNKKQRLFPCILNGINCSHDVSITYSSSNESTYIVIGILIS